MVADLVFASIFVAVVVFIIVIFYLYPRYR